MGAAVRPAASRRRASVSLVTARRAARRHAPLPPAAAAASAAGATLAPSPPRAAPPAPPPGAPAGGAGAAPSHLHHATTSFYRPSHGHPPGCHCGHCGEHDAPPAARWAWETQVGKRDALDGSRATPVAARAAFPPPAAAAALGVAPGSGVVRVTPSGALLVGAAGARHKAGCACPNCNTLRGLLRRGEAVQVEAEEEGAPPPLPPTPAQLAEREANRRARISSANTGKVPWNVGQHHSEATRARISAATRAAMTDPDLRARLSENAKRQAHGPEFRAAISRGLVAAEDARRVERLAPLLAAFVSAVAPPWDVLLPDAACAPAEPHRPPVRRPMLLPFLAAALAAQRASLHPPPPVDAPSSLPAAALRRRLDASDDDEDDALASSSSLLRPKPRGNTLPKSPAHRAAISAGVRGRWSEPEFAARVRARQSASATAVGSARTLRRRAAAASDLSGDGDAVLAQLRGRAAAAAAAAAARRREGGNGGGGAGGELAPPRRAAPRRRALTADEAAAREAMAREAEGMLARAQAVASQLSDDPGMDPRVLTAVRDAVAKAQATLDRLGESRAAAASQQLAAQAAAQAAIRAARGLPPLVAAGARGGADDGA